MTTENLLIAAYARLSSHSGPVGLWRQLVQLDVQDRPEFSELGFRQRYPVGVQFAAADGHMLRTSLVDRCRV